nr:hypothetical protein [Tanacetum cinerariifolium]
MNFIDRDHDLHHISRIWRIPNIASLIRTTKGSDSSNIAGTRWQCDMAGMRWQGAGRLANQRPTCVHVIQEMAAVIRVIQASGKHLLLIIGRISLVEYGIRGGMIGYQGIIDAGI